VDEKSESIGELSKEPNGHLTWISFSKILFTSYRIAKEFYSKKKADMFEKRREALETNDITRYRYNVM